MQGNDEYVSRSHTKNLEIFGTQFLGTKSDVGCNYGVDSYFEAPHLGL